MNLNDAKKLYTEGTMSQAELAGFTGISVSKIKKAAQAEGWLRLRKSNQSYLKSLKPADKTTGEPLVSVPVDRLEAETTEKIIILLNTAFSEACQYNRHVAKRRSMTQSASDGELSQTSLPEFDTKRLLDVVNALEKVVKLRREIISEKAGSKDETMSGVVVLPASDAGE